jgi:UDP-N-acetylmuramyl pentapeptide phosphotransferase/UDP-N-acetylglucosamine-1-phosphate transferase
MFWLIEFAIVGVLSYLGVRVMRYFAETHSILDVPNDRSSHTNSVPRGGGVPIVVLTIVGLWIPVLKNHATRGLVTYTAGAVLIAGISWLDDLYSVSTVPRFLIHSLAALLVIYGLGYLPVGNILAGSSPMVEWLSVAITFLWIVGLTNAYNFMDGIDGIAGSQALVAGIGWLLLGLLTGQVFVTSCGLLVSATALGFLIHNWSPAKIFMGDVASAFLGFTLATLPLIFNAGSPPAGRGLRVPFAGLIFVWPFVFDATLTFFRRLFRGERVFSAHRSHLYQRLVIAGHTHQFVSLLYSVFAATGVAFALAWILGYRNSLAGLVIVILCLCIGLVIFVRHEETANRTKLRANLATQGDSAPLAVNGET